MGVGDGIAQGGTPGGAIVDGLAVPGALTAAQTQALIDTTLVEQTLVDAAIIAYVVSAGRNANVTITATRVLNFTGVTAGQSGIIRVIQGGAGSFELTYTLAGVGGDVLFTGGVIPVLTNLAGSVDVLQWYYDGAKIHLTVRSLDSK